MYITPTRKGIKEVEARILKWNFIFWIGQIGAIMRLDITILKMLNN